LFESGAILIYLAEKSGMLMGSSASDKARTVQWLMFQMGGLGPMLGQLGFFTKFAGSEWEDKRPQERYIAEGKRLLAVLEKALHGNDWIIGSDYTIADIAIAPWLRALDFYGVKELLDWEGHPNLVAYTARFEGRAAVQKGLTIPPRG
jgi:GST-like protein